MVKLKPIHEQVVVIVGATSGIGLATAHLLAKSGARLVLAGRNEADLRATVEEVIDRGGQAVYVIADTSHWDQVRNISDQAVAHYGRIDTWFQNAGVSVYAKFVDLTPDEFRRVIEVNLLGEAYGAMAAIPVIRREGRGAILFNSSVEARIAMPYHSAYSASKHGIDGFVKALRMELSRDQIPISVTNILPAAMDTPFFEKSLTRIGVQPRPVPPVYDPGRVAEAVLYAATHPVAEIHVGAAGKVFQSLQRISPGLVDFSLRRIGMLVQRSAKPKTSAEPNNLFETVHGYHRVHGSQASLEAWERVEKWVQKHPLPAGIMAAAVLTAAVSLASQAFRNEKER